METLCGQNRCPLDISKSALIPRGWSPIGADLREVLEARSFLAGVCVSHVQIVLVLIKITKTESL